MSGHSKGPWTVPHFVRPEVGCECRYVLSDAQMGAICSVHCSGEGDWKETGDNPPFEQACANAHLIAAAPDLLECMKAAVSIIGHPDDAMTKHFNEVIAKATGAAK